MNIALNGERCLKKKSSYSKLFWVKAHLRLSISAAPLLYGLAAKPIIDIMIGLPDFSVADKLVPIIEALGYEYFKKYEDEMPYRRYFAKNSNGIRTHQIHMVEIGSEFWGRHLFFRDYLRQNPEIMNEYAALKKQLAEREWVDVNEYADAKSEFITGIENKAKEQAIA